MPYAPAIRCALLLVFTSGAAEGQTVSWRHEAARDIEYLHLTSRATLLASTSAETFVLDGDTGKALWARSDLRDCQALDASPVQEYEFKCHLEGSGGLNFVVLATERPRMVGHHAPDGRLAVIDMESGKTLFDAAAQKVGKVRRYTLVAPYTQVVLAAEGQKGDYAVHGVSLGDGALLWSFDSAISDDPVWLGSPAPRSVLLSGKNRAGERVLAEFDVEAGRNTWQSATVLKEEVREAGPRMVGAEEWRSKAYRVAPLIPDAEWTIAFVSRDGPMRFDKSGRVVWRAADLAGVDPTPMVLHNAVLFVRRQRDVLAVAATSGKTLWRQRTRVEPSALVALPGAGLLAWTSDRVDLLSFDTGAPMWPRVAEIPNVRDNSTWNSFSPGWHLGGISPFVVRDDKLFVAGGRTLAEIDLASGTRTDLANYQFQGGEAPETLELTDEGFLLLAHQNLVRVDRTGRERFAKFYPAPGLSGWAKLGLGALSVAIRNPALLTSAFRARIRDVADSTRDVYMHFENSEGRSDTQRFGLARLDAVSGDEKGVFWHNERRPLLVMNPESGVVFVRRNGRAIEAARFQ